MSPEEPLDTTKQEWVLLVALVLGVILAMASECNP